MSVDVVGAVVVGVAEDVGAVVVGVAVDIGAVVVGVCRGRGRCRCSWCGLWISVPL